MTLLIEALTIFRPMIQRITAYTKELLRLASTDIMTNTANRRYFMERAEAELSQSKRYERPLTLMMLDADHFKNINDTYGHAAGDEVLKALALEISKALRPSDILGRIGGEEFAVLLPETPISGAILLAERIRNIIQNTNVMYAQKPINFTVSVGVADVPLHPSGIDEALKIADDYLYQAKNKGRNCVMPEAT